MKASLFTDAQKAFIIKQGEDGMPVAEICRKAGISHVELATGASADFDDGQSAHWCSSIRWSFCEHIISHLVAFS